MKYFKKPLVMLAITLLVWLSISEAALAVSRSTVRGPFIEIGNGSSSEDEVEVPIRLHNYTRIASGSFTIDAPKGSDAFDLVGFKVAPKFNGKEFNTTKRVDGNRLSVDFILSDSTRDTRIDSETVGYAIYEVDEDFNEGEQAQLELNHVSIMDTLGRELRTEAFGGTLTKQRPTGDVLGTNKINAAQALRILQHLQGDTISRSKGKKVGDVDGNGNIDQMDAKKILRHVIGDLDSFISITNDTLPNAIVNQPYEAQIKVSNGGAPYQYALARGSRLPAGLRLDRKTGVIAGQVSDRLAGNYSFTVEVTDRNANTASKMLQLTAGTTNISSVESIDPISVEVGGTVNLPSEVTVTYKNGQRTELAVSWQPVDTRSVGTKTIKGMIGDTGEQVDVEVIVYGQEEEEPVIAEKQIENISNKVLRGIGQVVIHTIQVETTDNVYSVDVLTQEKNSRGQMEDVHISMHYEGDSRFSLATPRFESGQEIVVVAYGEFGNEITRKTYRLN